MPAVKHFNGPRVPKEERVKRVRGSTSFKREGKTILEITHNGKKVPLHVFSKGSPGGTFLRIVMHANKKRSAVTFTANNYNPDSWWNISHRYVTPDFRGHYLGRTGIRLMEQLVRKEGGKVIGSSSHQINFLRTCLSMGYSVQPGSYRQLKRALKLPQNRPLPSNKKLVQLLDQLKRKSGSNYLTDATPKNYDFIQIAKDLK
jgi:hypothetical protein